MTKQKSIRELFEEMVNISSTEIQHEDFTVPEFTKLLRSFVGSDDIKVKTERDTNVDLDQIIISGTYDRDDDEEDLPSITIYANYNPVQVTVRIVDLDWKQLCIDLIECIGHETIHQQQYRSRDYDIGSQIFASKTPNEDKRLAQEYLGNPDEIEAYGYSIAAEVMLKYFPRKLTSKHVGKSLVFKTYCVAFGTNHIIVSQLLQHSIKFFNQLKEVK